MKKLKKTKFDQLKAHIDEALEHKENSWLKVMEIVGDIAKDVIKLREETISLNDRLWKLERKKT